LSFFCPIYLFFLYPFCVQEPDCTKNAQGPMGKCFAHGGGKRCSHVDGLGNVCTKAAQGKGGLCRGHSGGNPIGKRSNTHTHVYKRERAREGETAAFSFIFLLNNVFA
jgi:hypothetical protein